MNYEVHKTPRGMAQFWFTKSNGETIYRITYANGQILFTNTMKLVTQFLKPKNKAIDQYQQLTFKF